jgi:hypothetical protein
MVLEVMLLTIPVAAAEAAELEVLREEVMVVLVSLLLGT